MSKTLKKMKETRSWIRHIDDERSAGNSIIVVLVDGYDFADDPGCGVKGFDTVKDALVGTTKGSITKRSEPVLSSPQLSSPA